jgi:hypothetical protein
MSWLPSFRRAVGNRPCATTRSALVTFQTCAVVLSWSSADQSCNRYFSTGRCGSRASPSSRCRPCARIRCRPAAGSSMDVEIGIVRRADDPQPPPSHSMLVLATSCQVSIRTGDDDRARRPLPGTARSPTRCRTAGRCRERARRSEGRKPIFDTDRLSNCQGRGMPVPSAGGGQPALSFRHGGRLPVGSHRVTWTMNLSPSNAWSERGRTAAAGRGRAPVVSTAGACMRTNPVVTFGSSR